MLERFLTKMFWTLVDSGCFDGCFKKLFKRVSERMFFTESLKWMFEKVIWEIYLRDLFTMVAWWFLARMFLRVVKSFIESVRFKVSKSFSSIVQIRFSGAFFQVFYRKLFFKVFFTNVAVRNSFYVIFTNCLQLLFYGFLMCIFNVFLREFSFVLMEDFLRDFL